MGALGLGFVRGGSGGWEGAYVDVAPGLEGVGVRRVFEVGRDVHCRRDGAVCADVVVGVDCSRRQGQDLFVLATGYLVPREDARQPISSTLLCQNLPRNTNVHTRLIPNLTLVRNRKLRHGLRDVPDLGVGWNRSRCGDRGISGLLALGTNKSFLAFGIHGFVSSRHVVLFWFRLELLYLENCNLVCWMLGGV